VTDVAAQVAAVRAAVADAAARAGRDPASIAIVAVAKGHPPDAIEAALAAGVCDIGENYAQELAQKRAAVTDPRLRWHFIGHLQRNKAKAVVGQVALIHAVDSADLGREIDRRAAALGIVQPVLVAVNAAGEATKHGVAPPDTAALVAELDALAAVDCVGLMTMPPLDDDPEQSRVHFRTLRALRDQLGTPARPLPELSMGTTADLAIAVEEGATIVRVGTAIFGPRRA
jgi:pyridoxal phosphate enzyme (YggS family)